MNNSTSPRAPRNHERNDDLTPAPCAGGYLLIPAAELAALWWAYKHDTIRFLDLRAALAAREMQARRRCRGDDRAPNFAITELANLTAATPRSLRGSLARLHDAGLLRWHAQRLEFRNGTPADPSGFDAWLDAIPNHRRRVPVPRRILRLLAASHSPVLVATTIAVLLRCLYARGGGLAPRGRIKASWVAATFGVDRRRVLAARRHLAQVGWIAPEPGDTQVAQNRWGRAYLINLDWAPRPGAEKTPPAADRGAGARPPLLPNRNPLARAENQDPATGGPAGVQSSGGEEGRLPAPNLKAVRPEDLADTGRLLELHRQAAARGVVDAGESGRLRVLAAAEHARSLGTRNPCGLFASLVVRGLWSYLTSADEDRASRGLRAFRRGPVASRSVASPPPRPSCTGPASVPPSSDAELLRAVRGASGGRVDPYLTLRCRSGGWPRDRYDRAVAELDGLGCVPSASPSPGLPLGVSGLGTTLSRLGWSVGPVEVAVTC